MAIDQRKTGIINIRLKTRFTYSFLFLSIEMFPINIQVHIDIHMKN